MARNGSGTYTVPNTFSSGSTISSADHNENFDDLGDEITNSVAADGQTSMTGPLKAASGSVSAPSLSFASDTDSGFYRAAANSIALALGGADAIVVTTATATFSGIVDATTVKQGGFRLVPAGAVMPYAGASAPDGWLFCYGQAVSRTTYADLYAAISTTYGVGDNSTTFNLPDLRGRVVAGQDDMGGSSADRLTGLTAGVDGDTLGAVGGAESHTLLAAQAAQKAISAAPVTVTDLGHTHTGGIAGGSTTYATGTGAQNGTTGSSTTGITAAFTLAGSDAASAHNNVQPTIILNYIIKV